MTAVSGLFPLNAIRFIVGPVWPAHAHTNYSLPSSPINSSLGLPSFDVLLFLPNILHRKVPISRPHQGIICLHIATSMIVKTHHPAVPILPDRIHQRVMIIGAPNVFKVTSLLALHPDPFHDPSRAYYRAWMQKECVVRKLQYFIIWFQCAPIFKKILSHRSTCTFLGGTIVQQIHSEVEYSIIKIQPV